MKTNIKPLLKKTWHFIWEDDSWESWAVNIIIAFVLVKFVIYPGLGLLLGTNLPVVAVVSGSMEHDNGFDEWWASQESFYMQYRITKEEFESFRLSNGFNKGDMIVAYSPKSLNVGDVIIFKGSLPSPLIHRIIEIKDNKITTKGDHNSGSRTDETGISNDKVYGKALFRLPYLGWFKIGFASLLGLFGINVS